MTNEYLNKELESEYEKIKLKIQKQANEAKSNWQKYVSKKMSESERKEYKEKIDRLSNRALVDFEESELAKTMFEFYRKAYKFNKKNILLLGDYFDENHLFILAARNNSESVIEVGLKKLSIQTENFDPRETILSLTILYNCLKKMDINPRIYFQEKSKIVDNWLSEYMVQYLTRDENINTFKAMGYTETTEPKFGLIWTG